MPNTIFYTASNLTHAFKSGYMKTWSLKIQYWSVPKKQMEYIYIYMQIETIACFRLRYLL